MKPTNAKLSEQFVNFIDLTDENLEEINLPEVGGIQGAWGSCSCESFYVSASSFAGCSCGSCSCGSCGSCESCGSCSCGSCGGWSCSCGSCSCGSCSCGSCSCGSCSCDSFWG